MKFLRPIFLTNLFFYLLGLNVLIYVIGFGISMFIYIGYGISFLLFQITFFEIFKTHKTSALIEARRMLPLHFSMSDANWVNIHIKNDGSKLIKLEIIDEIPIQFQDRNFKLTHSLEANERKILKYSLRPLTRGKYMFGHINLFFKSALGLIEFRKIFEAPATVKVYPSYVQMQEFEMQALNNERAVMGIRKIRRVGHGYDFSDIRQYVPGDDTRSINWKASSRTSHIMLNNYEDETSQQIYTIIDKSRTMRMPFDGLSLLDYSINASLALLNIAIKSKDNGGMLTFSKKTNNFVPAKRNNNQLKRIMDELYAVETSELEADFANLQLDIQLKIKNRSIILLFTNFLSVNSLKRTLPHLKTMAKKHRVIVMFFENTELSQFRSEPIQNSFDLASKILAEKLADDLNQVTYELRMAGIQAVHTKPEELTTNTINKYLEIKARGQT